MGGTDEGAERLTGALPITADAANGSRPGLFRGVARQSLIYGVGMVIGRAVSFLMLPIYTRYLTPADYGVIALVEMTLDFVTILAGSRLVVGFFHYYHAAKTEAEKEEAASTSFLLIAVLYAVVGCLVILFAGPLSQLIFQTEVHATVIRIAAANVAFQSLLIVPLAVVRVQDRAGLYVMANLAKLFLALGFNVLFLIILGFGTRGVFLASLSANALVGGVLAVWLVRRVGSEFSPSIGRRLLRFGVPLVLTSVATFVVTFGDRYFLKAVADETAVGLYNLSYTFGFLLVMVGYTPIDQVWGPKRFEVARLPDGGALLAKGFILLNVVLLTVAAGIGLLVFDVVRMMTTPAFHSAAAVVPVILLAYVLESWSGVLDIGILIRERTEYVTYANLLSAIAALIGYSVLIPLYLSWGAAIATAIAFGVRVIFTYRFSQRFWFIEYRWRAVLLLLGWASAIVGLGLALPVMPVVTSLMFRSALLLTYLAGLWVLPVLDPADKESAIAIVRNVITTRRAATAGARASDD